MTEFDPQRAGFRLVVFVVAAEVALIFTVTGGCFYSVTAALVPTGACNAVREDMVALMAALLATVVAIAMGRKS